MSILRTPETRDRADIRALVARTDPWSLDESEGLRLRQLVVLRLELVEEVESKQAALRELE